MRGLWAGLLFFLCLFPIIAFGAGEKKSELMPAVPSPRMRVLSANDFKNDPPLFANLLNTGTPFTTYIEMRGDIRADDKDALLKKIGAISSLKGIKYWSRTEGGWETLITKASALNGDSDEKRADFSSGELAMSQPVYFSQRDNRSSTEVIYKLHIADASDKRVIAVVENVSPVKYLMFSVFDPGDIKSAYVFENNGPDLWSYYNLYGVREASNPQDDAWKAYANRALSMYRHFAGIPTDQGPPLQP